MLSAVCCDLQFSSLRTEGIYFSPAATPKESVFLQRGVPARTQSLQNPLSMCSSLLAFIDLCVVSG